MTKIMNQDNECNAEYVTVPQAYIEELTQKADDCNYYRGRIDGLEYVIDTLENILKGEQAWPK